MTHELRIRCQPNKLKIQIIGYAIINFGLYCRTLTRRANWKSSLRAESAIVRASSIQDAVYRHNKLRTTKSPDFAPLLGDFGFQIVRVEHRMQLGLLHESILIFGNDSKRTRIGHLGVVPISARAGIRTII
jgi:hypothetical protein